MAKLRRIQKLFEAEYSGEEEKLRASLITSKKRDELTVIMNELSKAIMIVTKYGG
jgi:hypothetical protein